MSVLCKKRCRLTSLAIALITSVGVFQAAHGQSDDHVADPNKGKQIAEAQCVACHGKQGNSAIPAFPKLGGQHAPYTLKQLRDMKSGDRPVMQMAGIVAGLSDLDMQDVAAYYATQPVTLGGVDEKHLDLGQKIYRSGNKETGVPACAGCHGAKGKGLNAAGFPALSGQHTDYTKSQLMAFRSAGREDASGTKRANDTEKMWMRLVAKQMSDAEIEAVSNYISGLH